MVRIKVYQGGKRAPTLVQSGPMASCLKAFFPYIRTKRFRIACALRDEKVYHGLQMYLKAQSEGSPVTSRVRVTSRAHSKPCHTCPFSQLHPPLSFSVSHPRDIQILLAFSSLEPKPCPSTTLRCPSTPKKHSKSTKRAQLYGQIHQCLSHQMSPHPHLHPETTFPSQSADQKSPSR
jgi:hypothetical protein